MVTEDMFTPLSETQARVFADARTTFQSYQTAQQRVAQFPGWMFWKKYPSGRTYLVHAYDRTGKGTTLGGQHARNEAKLLAFKTQQTDAKLRLKMAKDRVTEQARFCKAARINRVPRLAAAIVRALSAQASPLQTFVIGSYALYVYEAFYGVKFSASTLDVSELSIVICTAEIEPPAQEEESGHKPLPLLNILRSIDDSFTESDHVMINDAGFKVSTLQLIQASKRRPKTNSSGTTDSLVGIDPVAILFQVVIDQDGLPLEMRAPDPRLFAANRRWLSMRKSRLPEERERDRLQSDVVAAIVRRGHTTSPAELPKLADIPPPTKLGPILLELGLAG